MGQGVCSAVACFTGYRKTQLRRSISTSSGKKVDPLEFEKLSEHTFSVETGLVGTLNKLHRFPSDPVIAQQWARLGGITYTPDKVQFYCSLHFDIKCFTYFPGLKRVSDRFDLLQKLEDGRPVLPSRFATHSVLVSARRPPLERVCADAGDGSCKAIPYRSEDVWFST